MKIHSLKRGNKLDTSSLFKGLSAPAIFMKETKDSEWDCIYACHDGAIVETELDWILSINEVEHFEKDSKYFEDDEQISIEDIDYDLPPLNI